ncbi:CRISPR-associated endonuclease/helicase Cas3 [Lentibacillus halodurans]|uniref:CRISPR-associated endonuclease/helicase Cas3 n=1 Tax=Lentibacillus halodurans TaxID=237679 RepID=A0A1I0WHN3_9BACI|nr:CRISPR-associated helicase/endonuclease Cas3 [Lentibacillus halodurans]SFA87748.1 CRISPR-associated endonuclease/helicase Cas3 [Lentibacillus halodurans]
MFIAKTRPEMETLKEHTDELLKRFAVLKNAYFDKIPEYKIWDLLYKAAQYHDLGKVNNDFQAKMHRALKTNKAVSLSNFGHIPHNYLSPFFLPVSNWNLSKNERRVLVQAIAYHHERNTQPDVAFLSKVYQEELIHHFNKVAEEMELTVPDKNQKKFKITNPIKPEDRIIEIKDDKNTYYLYILIKGLLHRLDHAASAHVPIEVDTDTNIAELTHNYMQENFGQNSLRPLQEFTYKNQDKNLIIVAQTGIGKTEASLLWAGKDKTFFTLPIRVSLNALYDRVHSDLNYKNVGLLHGTSASHLDENGDEDWEIIFDQSKNFSNKLLFTTIDQVLKFPFKFKGYEKFFATMAYSKVIIDEIQAYNPWIVAVLLKAIEMIHKIGGKFMIMTATMPQIYLDELAERGILDNNTIENEFVDESFIRHRISLQNMPISDATNRIIEMAANQKVLVIVNTVDRAIELFSQLERENVYLLHSRFIQRDRALLENEIRRFADEEENGIWITTQLVEASIDIDFDVLFTELSTIDSLLQRFGRCYRKRELEHQNPNVYIYTEDVSGRKYVYDEDILDLTERYLQSFDNRQLNEKDKVELVKKIYSKEELKGSKFYQDFIHAVHKLNHLEDYQYTNEEAQKILRGIQSVNVIPRNIYDEIIGLLETLEIEKDSQERTKLRRKIEGFMVSVPKHKYKSERTPIDFYQTGKDGRKYNILPYIEILDVEYDFDPDTLSGVGLNGKIESKNTIIFD